MSPYNFTHILTQAVDELSESESYKELFHQHKDSEPLLPAHFLNDKLILLTKYLKARTANQPIGNCHIFLL